MIIDGHAHMGGEYESLEAVLSALDKSGVDKVILTPTGTPGQKSMSLPEVGERITGPGLNFVINRLIRITTARQINWDHIESGNCDISEIASLSEGKIIQFIWVNPLRDDIEEEIVSKFNEWKFRGIKLHQSIHPFKIESASFYKVAELAGNLGIPLFIHLYSRKEVLDFISIARRFTTKFIVGHLIGLELFIDEKLKTGDNVFFDISCPPLVSADRIRLAVSKFGAEKIVMGSDTPYGINNIGNIISRVRSLNFTSSENDLILGGNMQNILGI